MPIDPDQFDREGTIATGNLTSTVSREDTARSVSQHKQTRVGPDRYVAVGIPVLLLVALAVGWYYSAHKSTASSQPRFVTQEVSRGEPPAKSRAQTIKRETIYGVISLVMPAQNFVFVTNSDGTPFKFVVTPNTTITIDSSESDVAALALHINERVQVVFHPLREGDIADAIKLLD